MSKEELDSADWTMTPAQKQQRLEEQRSGKRKMTEEKVDFSQLDKERIRNVQEYNVSFFFHMNSIIGILYNYFYFCRCKLDL